MRRWYQIEVELYGRALRGAVRIYPGSWGTLEDPPDPPEVDQADLRDEEDRPIAVDLDDPIIEAAILEAVTEAESATNQEQKCSFF